MIQMHISHPYIHSTAFAFSPLAKAWQKNLHQHRYRHRHRHQHQHQYLPFRHTNVFVSPTHPTIPIRVVPVPYLPYFRMSQALESDNKTGDSLRSKALSEIIKHRLAEALDSNDLEKLKRLQPLIEKAIDKPYNLALLGDAYKYSHHVFYDQGTTLIYSYLESRGGKFDQTVFYGLQILLQEFLEGVAITTEEIDEAEVYLHGTFGSNAVFDRSKFDYIVAKHQGRLPICIRAVPEGTIVPTKNVLLTIENTDPNCFWLTNFLETLLMHVWYPITVATLSREVRKIVTRAFYETSDLAPSMTNHDHPLDNNDTSIMNSAIDFVLNDFGFRGTSSVQAARNGGSAHLVNFMGSDTILASKGLAMFYDASIVYGLSVPATEHSVMTLRGEAGEVEMMERVLDRYPTGIVACVSDSYDIFRACSQYWGTQLRDKILARPAAPGNQLVIRPDSGHVLNSLKEIFRILFDKFGYTTNAKGFKVLPPQIRVIQGDGVNINSIIDIYAMLKQQGIAAENLVLGMGGRLLQADIDRDTQKFAMKASYAVVNGHERDVVKSPIELDEHGNFVKSFKKSKKGKLKLVKTESHGFVTMTSSDPGFDLAKDELVTVFENGVITKRWDFESIKKRARSGVMDFESIKPKYGAV